MFGEMMESEIEEQPRLLQELAGNYLDQTKNSLAKFKNKEIDLILLIARGSSDNAALYARYLIEIHLGIPVSLAAPSVLTRFHSKIKYKNCLAIGISQSGAGPDIADVLASLKESGHQTVSITNTQGSLISRVADQTIYLEVGDEKSVAATKTYSATLLCLFQLVRELQVWLGIKQTLDFFTNDQLPSEEWLNHVKTFSEENFGIVARGNPVISLARGYDFCTAQETALKLMECALIPAKSYSTADFQHGPRALAGAGSTAVIFGETIAGLAEQGCNILNAPIPNTNPILAPIWNVLFSQWLALHCARGRGLNPDAPHFIRKVTKTR